MKKLVIKLIRWYQRRISPLTPPSCRHTPTCSNYTIEAVERFGCLYGCFIGMLRILRCNPLFPAGYDPVPQEKFSRIKNKKAK